MVNRHKPHIYVIPEDDANRQIAVGFELDYRLRSRVLQVMKPAGGWRVVIDMIIHEYIVMLQSNLNANVVGIIDCDGHEARIAEEFIRIPENLRDRVFILGTLREPENFKESVRLSFEKIGRKLADECFCDEFEIWNHEDLIHIKDEVRRAKSTLRPILFGHI